MSIKQRDVRRKCPLTIIKCTREANKTVIMELRCVSQAMDSVGDGMPQIEGYKIGLLDGDKAGVNET